MRIILKTENQSQPPRRLAFTERRSKQTDRMAQRRHYKGCFFRELWFQQDGTTCHTARATIDLLKDTFGDRPNFTFWTCELASKTLWIQHR
ncbi:hypothetical protein TNCV_3458331 [Trichonephila clavipes]|nr:hypothetical protein TNCV_3458331 [Trichonephila clavipes]